MVVGLNKFKEAFADFKDNYVIIGGTACDIVLSDTDMRPRATDDIDMILVVEKMTKEYGDAFWQFIKDGEYKVGKREKDDKTPTYTLYRFTSDKEGYPVKIELLSHHSYILGEPSGFHIEPVLDIPVHEPLLCFQGKDRGKDDQQDHDVGFCSGLVLLSTISSHLSAIFFKLTDFYVNLKI